MMVKKKFVLVLIILILLIIGIVSYTTSHYVNVKAKTLLTKPSQLILFYGIGCPHCAKVEAFLKENSQKKLIAFTKKEVYKNRANQIDLIRKAKACGAIINNSIPIPLLWQGNNKCIYGDDTVIKYFHQLMRKK